MLINGGVINTVAVNAYSQSTEYVVGIASYAYGTKGSTTTTAVAGPSTVSYVVSTDGRLTPAIIVEGVGSYSVDSYGRSNVIKYSQEVLEEFACITYNVGMCPV